MTEKLNLEAIEARCEAARREVNRLCQGKTSWTMSIPVRADDTDVVSTDSFRDIPALTATDVVLTDSFRDIPALVAEVRQLQRRLFDTEADASFHKRLYTELKEFTDEWKYRAEKAEAEVKRLRASLEAVLEEAESDLDRDIILTECWSALAEPKEAT